MTQIQMGLDFMDVTVVTTGASYQVVNEEVVVVKKTSGSATTITLPKVGTNTAPPSNALFRGHVIWIKDGKGDAATNHITIQDPNSYTIDGASSLVISTNYGKAALMWNGTEWSQLV